MEQRLQLLSVRPIHKLMVMSQPSFRSLLRGKIHGATVTDANVNYEGSVTVDAELLDASGITEYEQVHILSLTTGERLTTYAIRGNPGSGVVCVNGAAAHMVKAGEKVIILTYALFHEQEVAGHQPLVVHVDAQNMPRQAELLPS